MTEKDDPGPRGLPDKMAREIASLPGPSPEKYRMFAFVLEGIREDIERAAEMNSVPGLIVQAIFSAAGELLHRVTEGIEEILAVPRPGMLARAIAENSVSPPMDTFISGLRIPSGDHVISIEWHCNEAGPILRLNVLKPDKTPVRPLAITVTDETGKPRFDPLEVSLFVPVVEILQPVAGIWFFQISWSPNKKRDVCIEVR